MKLENKSDEMNSIQYTELTKSITKLSGEVNKLHNKVGSLDSKVTSISNYISGDPSIPGQKGSRHTIESLQERVKDNEKNLQRIERLDQLEEAFLKLNDKVDGHEEKFNTIWTVKAVAIAMAVVIGTLMGIFIPPML